MGFYENHSHYSEPKEHNMPDELKLSMFQVIKDTCDAYDIPLNNQEDADNFWMLIRYGYTAAEREEQALLMEFISAKYPKLLDEMKEWLKKKDTD